MSILRRTLLAGIVIVVTLGSSVSAQQDGGARPDFEVEYVEDPSIEADGHLDASWQEGAFQQLEMQSTRDDASPTYAQVYMVQNGTHLFVLVIGERLETVTLQFDPSGGDDAAGRSLDGLRVSGEGGEDLHYDTDAGGWVADGEGCDVAAGAARADQDASTVFETAKALSGDDCDMFVPLGSTIGFRLLATRGDESFRWPADTEDLDSDGGFRSELAGWGTIVIEDPFDDTDTGEEVSDGGDGQQRDPGLFTGDEPGGFDGDAPLNTGGGGPADPYDPEGDDRDTPAPGLVALLLVAVGALFVAARLRRSD